MRLAIILALALAACTGKNAAKGTVEYVPVVPLSVLEGAGGEPTEPDAEVGGDEAAGGAMEADAGAGGAAGNGDAGEADAGDVVDARGPALECADGPAFPDGESVVFDESLESGCASACARFVECAVGASGLCPCFASAEPRPVVQSCMDFCMGTPDAEFRNAVGHDRTCPDIVTGVTGAVGAIGAACHGAGQ